MAKKKRKPSKKNISSSTYEDWFIFQNRVLILSLLGIFTVLYFIMSYAYPYPYYDPDSPTYILSALTDKVSGYRPFGYSKVLQMFHGISDTHTYISFAQYWFMAFSGLILIMSVKKLIEPKNNWIFYIFCFLFMLSPSTLFITTSIMSDSVFISLSWLWLAGLFYMISNDIDWKWWLMLLLHLFIMYWIVYIRYAGIVFPIVSTVVFVFRYKWLGLCLAPVALILAMWLTNDAKKDMKNAYDYETTSGFSGWLKANNALSIIPHTDITIDDFDTQELKTLHNYVIQQPDSVYSTYNVMKARLMWDNDKPLKRFFYYYYNMNKDKKGYIYIWTYCGDVYDEYANIIIKKHPWKYFKHYILQNFKRIFYYPYQYNLSAKNYAEHNDKNLVRYYSDINLGDVTQPHWDFHNQYFNFVYLKWISILKWIAALITFILFFMNRKRVQFTNNQKNIFISLLILNVLYYGMLVLVVPLIPRLALVVYASQMILLYMMLNKLANIYFNKVEE